MKWFKHMTAAHRDPKLIALRTRDGLEGLARWWLILELLAEEMNDTDRHEVRISSGYLSRFLGFRSSIDCRSFVDRLAIDQLLIADTTSNDWLLKCPNLLKIRDHRIKNRVRKSAPEADTEADKDKEPPSPILGKEEQKPRIRSSKRKNRLNGPGSTINDWELQWIKITGHIRTKGTSVRIEGLSEKGLRSLQMIGGMHNLGQANHFKMDEYKKSFRISYLSLFD